MPLSLWIHLTLYVGSKWQKVRVYFLERNFKESEIHPFAGITSNVISPFTPTNIVLPEALEVCVKSPGMTSFLEIPSFLALSLMTHRGTWHSPAWSSCIFLCSLSASCWRIMAEGRSWNPRDQTVSLHWLAGSRGPLPCHRAAGVRPAGQIQEPAQRRPVGGPLQVSSMPRASEREHSEQWIQLSFGVVKTFWNLIKVMVAQHCEDVKCH